MGMRKYYRQIARARMTAAGVGNVNRKMARMNGQKKKLWREVVFGSLAKDAEANQIRAIRHKNQKRILKKMVKKVRRE